MDLHYKKDGSLDMRYSSSKAAMSSGFGMGSSGYSGGPSFSPMSFGSAASSGLHFKKDGTLDMRYSSSRAVVAPSAHPSHANRPSSSSGLHYKKDGSLDMRYGSSRAAASSVHSTHMNRPVPNTSELHYKKDGSLDMRYSTSKLATPATHYSNTNRLPANSSGLHYKKDRTLDMRYASSKSAMSNYTHENPFANHGIPRNIPVTKNGIPDMRTTAAKEWVKQQAQTGIEDIPSWIPKTKDGSPDIAKAITQEYLKWKDTPSTNYDPDQRLCYYLQKLEDMFYRNLVENAREEPVQMPEYEMLPETSEIQRQFACQSMGNGGSQYSSRAMQNSIRQDNDYDIRSEISESVPVIDYRDLNIDPEDKLGRGAFGIVYKGRWNGQIVAVKQLHVNQLTRQEKRSFVKEIRIMSTLGKHRNLVDLYGYTLEPPCLVMEYIQLGSLSYLLHYCEDQQVEAKITDGRIKKKLILGIVLGMIQLHTVNIVHGDLKPQNILVSEDYTAKVTDFGFAILRGKTSSSIASSVIVDDDDSPVCGTAAYMAPELLNSSNPADYSSDVYSFGVMLNEVIQEEEPYSDQFRNFLGRGPFAAVNYARSGKRPRIGSRTPFFLKNLIEKCWNPDPRNRPTFQQIFEDLQPPQVRFPDSFDL